MNIHKLFKYNLLLFVREKQNLFLLSFFPILLYIILGESFSFLAPNLSSGENVIVISQKELPNDIKSYLNDHFVINSYVVESINKSNDSREHFISKQIKKGFQVLNIDYKDQVVDVILYTVKGYERIFKPIVQKFNLQGSKIKDNELRFREETLSVKIPDFSIFLFPGIMIMSILNTCLFGIGTELSSFKEKGILKRLFITPMRMDAFLSSYLLSRFLLIVIQVILIFIVNKVIFNTGLEGVNFYSLGLMLLLTTIMATLMGFLVFSVSNSFSSSNSLANYISMPMLFFSGSFFPVDSSPIFSKISLIIPITPTVNILRSIIIYNDKLDAYMTQFAILVIWIVVFSALAVLSWRFKNKQLV